MYRSRTLQTVNSVCSSCLQTGLPEVQSQNEGHVKKVVVTSWLLINGDEVSLTNIYSKYEVKVDSLAKENYEDRETVSGKITVEPH